MNTMFLSVTIALSLLSQTQGWKPPGMSERVEEASHDHSDLVDNVPVTHQSHHDHSDNVDVVDLVTDTEHMVDDLGEFTLYTKTQLDKMEVDQKVFLWFSAHDWDENAHLDGLELLKALSHDHNYHHEAEESIPEGDTWHDTAQHTEPAERQRFRRTEKIVDRILEEDDSDKDGLVSFSEFMSALHAGKLDGLKIRKTRDQN